MFSIPRVNVIESDQGFSVEVLGRTGLLYCDGSDETHIDSEVLAGPKGLVVFSSSIRTWQNGSPIDEVTRDRIVDNIRRALAWRGFDIEVA